MQTTRRQFIQVGGATLLSGSLGGCVSKGRQAVGRAEQEPSGAGYIDAHAHVWSDDLDAYPLGPWATRSAMKPLTFTDEQLLAVMRPHGVTRAVLIQHAPLHGYDNSYILDCARKRPDTFSVVAMINERTPNLKQRLKVLRDAGARGIRIGPTKHADRTLNVDPPNWLNAPGMQRLWQHAAELDVAVCPLLGPAFLPSLDPMCEQYPDTTVVIDHFGHMAMDQPESVAALTRLARHPKVYVKASGFYKFGDKRAPYEDVAPMVRVVLDAFGAERVMWASDCPYQLNNGNTFGDAVALIRDGMGLSDPERDMILKGTAERIFF